MFLLIYFIGCVLSLLLFIVSKSMQLKYMCISRTETYEFAQLLFIFIMSWLGVGMYGGVIISVLILKKNKKNL